MFVYRLTGLGFGPLVTLLALTACATLPAEPQEPVAVAGGCPPLDSVTSVQELVRAGQSGVSSDAAGRLARIRADPQLRRVLECLQHQPAGPAMALVAAPPAAGAQR